MVSALYSSSTIFCQLLSTVQRTTFGSLNTCMRIRREAFEVLHGENIFCIGFLHPRIPRPNDRPFSDTIQNVHFTAQLDDIRGHCRRIFIHTIRQFGSPTIVLSIPLPVGVSMDMYRPCFLLYLHGGMYMQSFICPSLLYKCLLVSLCHHSPPLPTIPRSNAPGVWSAQQTSFTNFPAT